MNPCEGSMLALFRTFSLRYLRRRWFWALLVVASIALGVAMLAATQALNQTMVKAGGAAANPLAGFADLQVSNGDFGVGREVAERLRAAHVPGVQAVQPLVVGRVLLPDLDNRAALLLGADQPADGQAGNAWGIEFKLTSLPLLTGGQKPVLVGSELARAFPRGIGSFRVRVAGQERRVTGIGTVQAKGPAAALGGGVLVMAIADAAVLLGQPDRVTRIDVALAPGSDREQVRRRLEEVLAGAAEVRTPEAVVGSIRDVMAGLEIALFLGGAGALVVGLFLVYNALAVSVAERRHDIGILRSLGATRAQVAGLFAGEAGILGLAGAVLGAPVGLALAGLAIGPMQEVLSDVFLPMQIRQIEITPRAVVGAIVAGVVTALLAALVPALQAAMEEPAEAVRRVPRVPALVYRLVQVAVVGLLVLAGVAGVALRGVLPPRLGAFGGVVSLLVAGLVASPLLAAGAAQLLRPVARRLLGIEGRLAADNLARSPGRTGLVIASLAAGVALVLETAGVTLTSEKEVLDWIDSSIAADIFVSGNSPVSSGTQNIPLEADLGRQLAAVPGVTAALPARFQRVDFRDKLVFLIALDAPGFAAAHERRGISPRRWHFNRLTEPGTAVVSENFAALYGVGEGDRIRVRGPRGPVEMRIVGTVVDYSWNRGVVFVDLGWYRSQFGDDLVDVFDLFLQPGADPEAVREAVLRRWGAEHALVALTRAELRQRVSDTIHQLYAIPYAQGVVVGLVAGLGVVIALLISVLQRRRELGLLRAVGASRAQVLRSVLAEATLMGLIGAAIGLLVGVPLEWYAVRVILFDEAGFLFPVRVPWLAAAGITATAVGLATLAGLGPALRTLHLRIPEAIAYE
jgi:putative ABC transport system permease protein